MTLQMEGPSTAENQTSVPVEDEVSSEKSSAAVRRNPPARNTSRFWFERFLAVIQRQNPPVIDSSFLSQIAPSNEGKLLAQLKFLKVIDDRGRPTQVLPLLNMVGEAQKNGFHQMMDESYFELLNEVKIEKAVPDDIVNYFIRKYSYTREKAVYASKFFLYLADKSSIQISQEMRTFYNEKALSNQNGSTSGLGQATLALAGRASAEKTPKIPVREQRINTKNGKKDQYQTIAGNPTIHATVEIKLDKDTPKELWDRVLALLGEKRIGEDIPVEVSDSKKDGSESASSSEVDQQN